MGLPHGTHQFAHQGGDYQQYHTAHGGNLRQVQVAVGIPRQSFQVGYVVAHLSHARAQQSGHVLAVGAGQEPHAHHQALNAGWGQLGHQAQPNGTEEQLTERDDEVTQNKDFLGRHAGLRVGYKNRGVEHVKGKGQQQKCQSKLDDGIRLCLPFGQCHPYKPKDGGEQNDKQGVGAVVGNVGVQAQSAKRWGDVVQGKQAQGAAALLKKRPEQNGKQDEHQGGAQFFIFCGRELTHFPREVNQGGRPYDPHEEVRVGRVGHHFQDERNGEQGAHINSCFPLGGFHFGQVRQRTQSDGPQSLAGKGKRNQGDGHDHGNQAKRHGPAVEFADVHHQNSAQEGADVDAGIEQAKSSVASGIVLVVQLAHHGGNVGFKEARAYDVEGNAQVEQFRRRYGNDGAARNHEQSAPKQGTLEAQNLVCHDAADEGEGVDKGLDGAVLKVGVFLAQVQLRHHENRQHAAQAVEAETLPHFGEEQPPELAGVGAAEVANAF